MNRKYKICIIIPCYNEGTRFQKKEYSNFLLSNKNTLICFVNDGSTDDTLELLYDLKSEFFTQIEILSFEKNAGKAEAVRQGLIYVYENIEFSVVAYLDADLAVSLEECVSMARHINYQIYFCIGSRIAIIGSQIDRKLYRHLIGRFIATLISIILDLKVYDTQCGCKLFSKEIPKEIFSKPFISRWLFDVEIFFRLMNFYGRKKAVSKMIEIPLIRWIDKGQSKVNLSYFFNLWTDLYEIYRTYNKESQIKK